MQELLLDDRFIYCQKRREKPWIKNPLGFGFISIDRTFTTRENGFATLNKCYCRAGQTSVFVSFPDERLQEATSCLTKKNPDVLSSSAENATGQTLQK
jgi:hypothetical protein